VSKREIDPDDPEQVVRVISDFCNRMGGQEDIEKFVEFMDREHRTLQQGFTRVLVAWIRHLASLKENWYDLRNEASVKLAKKIMESVPYESLFLPFI